MWKEIESSSEWTKLQHKSDVLVSEPVWFEYLQQGLINLKRNEETLQSILDSSHNLEEEFGQNTKFDHNRLFAVFDELLEIYVPSPLSPSLRVK